MSQDGHGGDAGRAIAICIPARDEAQHLPRLFDAIDRLIVPDVAAVALCLMLDGCVDDSLALALSYRQRSRHDVRIVQVDRSPPNAGAARHRAMTACIAAVGNGDAVLLSTDADSEPAPNWLIAMCDALDRCDLVVGDVVRQDRETAPAQTRIEEYYGRLFALRRQIDPVAWEAPVTHHHASGANLGLRASVYRRLGGFLPLPSGEDARLVDDAARAGFRVRRDAVSIVHTSARRLGRVQGGLATTLRTIDRHGLESVVVAHPADQVWQYRMQALARLTFDGGGVDALAEAIGLAPDALLGTARDCPNAEAFAMRVVPVPPGGMRHVPFTTAEAMLAVMTDAAPPAAAA